MVKKKEGAPKDPINDDPEVLHENTLPDVGISFSVDVWAKNIHRGCS